MVNLQPPGLKLTRGLDVKSRPLVEPGRWIPNQFVGVA